MLNRKIFLLVLFVFSFSFAVSSQIDIHKKDTLNLKYDRKLLVKKKHNYENYTYYYLKNSGNNGFFYFKQNKKKLLKNKINPICVKDILKSRQFYSGKNNTSVIDDWELYMYFKEKSIYLIKGDSIIELEPSYLIE